MAKLSNRSEATQLFLKIAALVCTAIFLPVAHGDGRRPIYNIAHMANSIKDLEDFLGRGANGIELDISFHKNGSVKSAYHGYPCDCYRICDEREKLDKYLNYVRDISDPNGSSTNKQLLLLLFDLKVDEVARSQKFKAGEEIAKHLISHLWNKDKADPRISVIVSIGHTSDADVVRGILDTFRKSNKGTFLKKLGFDVGLGDDLDSIRKMWTKLKIKSNRWQGDGVTNCFRPLRDDGRLRQAVRYRDTTDGHIEKVYDWTVDLTANMRHSLRIGVDAILTNFPERVHSVLQEPEFRDTYRLATKDDSPFSRVSVSPIKVRFRQPNLDTYVGSVREMTVALMGYFWDFYRLRLQNPSTLFPLLQDIFFRALPAARQYKTELFRLARSGLIG